MSGSQIFLFEDMVLKIQEVFRETENEAAVCSWLAGRLPVPEILEYIVSGDKAYCLMIRIRGKMFFQRFGIKEDWGKRKYYVLLDELF